MGFDGGREPSSGSGFAVYGQEEPVDKKTLRPGRVGESGRKGEGKVGGAGGEEGVGGGKQEGTAPCGGGYRSSASRRSSRTG